MVYKVTIRRKNGTIVIRNVYSEEKVEEFKEIAKNLGDKVIRVVDLGKKQEWTPEKGFRDLNRVIISGATLGIGLGVLGAAAGAFSN